MARDLICVCDRVEICLEDSYKGDLNVTTVSQDTL